jgi:hypothetical protein
MEKRVILRFWLVLVCAVLAIPACSRASTAFSDDFEDGDISDWTITASGSGYMAAEQYPGPDWSLNAHSPSGTSSRAQALSPTFQLADSLDYSVSLELCFETPIHWIEVFRNAHVNTVIDDCPGTYCTFRCRYGGINYIIDSLYAYTTYSIGYEVNPQSETYDVYVGGVFKRTCDFDPCSIPFPQFRIGDVESGSSNYGVAMYDDFLITQIPAAVGPCRDVPQGYELAQNRPNPFRTATEVAFAVPEKCHVDLKVYDVRGRVVKTLLCRTVPAGGFSLGWDAEDDTGSSVRPGIYFVRLETRRFACTRKMMLLP